MGTAASKQRNQETNMEGNSRAVSTDGKKHRHKHGIAQIPTEDSQQDLLKETENIVFKGARVPEEEPIQHDDDVDGARRINNSVQITNFNGDNSKLHRYFKRKYPSDFKQVRDGDWGTKIVEFKSRQVAKNVAKDSHKVGETVLKVIFDSEPMTKDATGPKDKDREKDVTSTPGTKKESHLYPFPQMYEAEIASQDGNRISKENSRYDAFKSESHNNNHMTMSSQPTKTATLHSMQGCVSDKEDIMGNGKHQAKVKNELAKFPKIDVNERDTKSVDEMAVKLDAVKVEFIKKVHRIEYDEIRHKNDVAIATERDAESQLCKVTFRTEKPGKGNVDCACEQFKEMYRRISDTLSRNNTVNVLKELPDCTIRSLNRALTLANADGRVLVKNCLSDDFNVVFYGSKINVANAIGNFIVNSGRQDDPHGREGNTDPQPCMTYMQTMDTQDRVRVRTLDDNHFEGTVGDITISAYEGDLTRETVDVVVNAANERLEHAGGVAFAISEAGGKAIQKESREYVRMYGTLPIGQAMHTGAGKMRCKYVIHTVGPKWKSHGDKETAKAQLYEALFNVLYHAANKLKAKSIAIPAISAGIYGVPVDVCAEQLMLATQKFAQSPPGNNTLRDIRFVNIDGQINRTFVRIFSGSFPSNTTASPRSEPISDQNCPICMDKVEQPKWLRCCNNVFCTDCIDKAFQVKPVCPTCGYQSGVLRGIQPKSATMAVATTPRTLPGYDGYGTIQIIYDVPDGFQEACHPNPGRPYQGTRRMAFLPDNREGRQVLQLLRRAFDSRLVFTVGTSVTTGETDVVIWNDIHHKTSPLGGPSKYGYPDPGYLRRVTDELAAKGIR